MALKFLKFKQGAKMPKISTAADYAGIRVLITDKVDLDSTDLKTLISEAIPIGHMEDFSPIISATRPVKKYTPINDKDFSQIVATGSIEYGEFNATILFDFNGNDGVNKIKDAFYANKDITLIIEMSDAPDGDNTIIAQIIKISEFTIGGEKDGKTTATIKAEKIGNPHIKTKG